jgi:hypothetical protein
MALSSERPSRSVAASSYVESFTGHDPAAPQDAYGHSSLSVDLQNRNDLEMTSTTGEHGSDCGAPPASHNITSDEGHVYYCRNHLMTAPGDAGYSVIYLTADNLVDFSSGATLSWRQDFQRGSSRSWVDMWIQPVADNLALPLEHWQSTDLQGAPKNGVHVVQRTTQAGSIFDATVYRNFDADELDEAWWDGLEEAPGYTSSAMRRDLVQVDLSPTHIKVSMPEYGLVWLDQEISPALPFTKALVQWGHHEYTPEKGCKSSLGGPCGPDTVHWDDFQISPSVPFQIIRSDKRSGTVFNFDKPAPANSWLRFSAHGDPTLSFNGGASATAHKQASTTPNDGHAASFWHPVPPGATSVTIEGDRVKDVYVFAVDAGPSDDTPPPTASPRPPTSTQGPTASPTPFPTPAPAVAGDLDCDGLVTPQDALAQMRLIAEIGGEAQNCSPDQQPASPSGDVNCDNLVNAADVTVILQYIAGLGPPPGSCGLVSLLGSTDTWRCDI